MDVFSKNLLVYYWKCCNLIGYATRYLLVNRYRVAASIATRSSFSPKKQQRFWRNNEHKFVFTETIRLLALIFYEVLVSS